LVDRQTGYRWAKEERNAMLELLTEKLTQAERLLREVEHEYGHVLAQAFADAQSQGIACLDRQIAHEILHIASHETGTTVGFALQDLQLICKRLEIRLQYPFLTDRLFDRIITTQWSVHLVKEVEEQLATLDSMPIQETSTVIKKIQSEWSRLAQLGGHYTAQEVDADRGSKAQGR
jgi:hypothetical protein